MAEVQPLAKRERVSPQSPAFAGTLVVSPMTGEERETLNRAWDLHLDVLQAEHDHMSDLWDADRHCRSWDIAWETAHCEHPNPYRVPGGLSFFIEREGSHV